MMTLDFWASAGWAESFDSEESWLYNSITWPEHPQEDEGEEENLSYAAANQVTSLFVDTVAAPAYSPRGHD